MKLKCILICLFLSLSIITNAGAQENKFILGISYGTMFEAESDIWVGNPYNIWIDQTTSTIYGAFAYYNLSAYHRLGLFADYETGEFNALGIPDPDVSRIGFGTLWLGKYPDYMIHLQLGGFFGYTTMISHTENYENEDGIFYGIIAGPAIEYKNYGFAVHYHIGFLYLPSKGEPDEYSSAYSRIKFKVYYSF